MKISAKELEFQKRLLQYANEHNINCCIITPTGGAKINSADKEFNLKYIKNVINAKHDDDSASIKELYSSAFKNLSTLSFKNLYQLFLEIELNGENYCCLFADNVDSFPKWVVYANGLEYTFKKATTDLVDLREIVKFDFSGTKCKIISMKPDNHGESVVYDFKDSFTLFTDVIAFNLLGDDGELIKEIIQDLL